MRLFLNTLLFLVLSFFFFNIAGLEASTLFAHSVDVTAPIAVTRPIDVLANR